MANYELTVIDADVLLRSAASTQAEMIAELVNGPQQPGKNVYPIVSEPPVNLVVDEQEGGKTEIHRGLLDVWLGVSGTTLFRLGKPGEGVTKREPLRRGGIAVIGEFVGDRIAGNFTEHAVGPRDVLVIPANAPHNHRPHERGKSALLVVKVPARRRRA